MTVRKPIYLHDSPEELREIAAGDYVDPATLGSGTADGTSFLRGDQSWATPGGGGLGDVAGPASATDERVARFDGTTGKLIQNSPVAIDDAGAITGLTTVDGRDVSVDGTKLDTSANLTATARRGGTGIFSAPSTSLAARAVVSGRQVALTQSGNDIVLAHEPSRWRFDDDRPARVRSNGTAWIAGATTDPPAAHGALGDEHLWPFMVATAITYDGYPNYNYRRMESNLSDGNSTDYTINGYEEGVRVIAGDLIGRKLRWEMVGLVQNGLNADAFLEAVIEPNPNADTATGYEGANRLRMVSEELGATWSGDRLCMFTAELAVLARKVVGWWGHWRIFGSGGAKFLDIERGGTISNYGFDWLATDAVVSLRWRVERIANRDLYPQSSANQGTTLRWDVRQYAIEPIGFDRVGEEAE